MENIYKDPENKEEILEKIRNCATLKDIEELIKEVYPTWILYYISAFSHDYPHLQSNWEYATKQNNIKKGQILIVDYFNQDDENIDLIKIFCEIFTMSGFMVRTKDELTPCKVCNLGIPSLDIYNKMKEVPTLKILDEWSDTCTTCK